MGRGIKGCLHEIIDFDYCIVLNRFVFMKTFLSFCANDNLMAHLGRRGCSLTHDTPSRGINTNELQCVNINIPDIIY